MELFLLGFAHYCRHHLLILRRAERYATSNILLCVLLHDCQHPPGAENTSGGTTKNDAPNDVPKDDQPAAKASTGNVSLRSYFPWRAMSAYQLGVAYSNLCLLMLLHGRACVQELSSNKPVEYGCVVIMIICSFQHCGA